MSKKIILFMAVIVSAVSFAAAEKNITVIDKFESIVPPILEERLTKLPDEIEELLGKQAAFKKKLDQNWVYDRWTTSSHDFHLTSMEYNKKLQLQDRINKALEGSLHETVRLAFELRLTEPVLKKDLPGNYKGYIISSTHWDERYEYVNLEILSEFKKEVYCHGPGIIMLKGHYYTFNFTSDKESVGIYRNCRYGSTIHDNSIKHKDNGIFISTAKPLNTKIQLGRLKPDNSVYVARIFNEYVDKILFLEKIS